MVKLKLLMNYIHLKKFSGKINLNNSFSINLDNLIWNCINENSLFETQFYVCKVNYLFLNRILNNYSKFVIFSRYLKIKISYKSLITYNGIIFGYYLTYNLMIFVNFNCSETWFVNPFPLTCGLLLVDCTYILIIVSFYSNHFACLLYRLLIITYNFTDQ